MRQAIDRLLDDAVDASASGKWSTVQELAGRILTLDPDNEDAQTFLVAAQRGLGNPVAAVPVSGDQPVGEELPTSFANGRYEVTGFPGQGGKK
ncbi:MAG: hypothetical protein IH868_08155, partial [Chloroflexi bacterium]|nr:hypothetical protein [Chloroflexota bacterium]